MLSTNCTNESTLSTKELNQLFHPSDHCSSRQEKEIILSMCLEMPYLVEPPTIELFQQIYIRPICICVHLHLGSSRCQTRVAALKLTYGSVQYVRQQNVNCVSGELWQDNRFPNATSDCRTSYCFVKVGRVLHKWQSCRWSSRNNGWFLVLTISWFLL